ncbi:hypothetical protein QJS10_CPA10g01433 [Acorus calamus]|uniref:Uncharacterized protein n=1 Tax=Acorus calamus TaxID=4465 RepID=A0AAV9E5R8_ACOCL|nr:hypothetical protein QJS10_CPA10g01433 [Acorus calamus]
MSIILKMPRGNSNWKYLGIPLSIAGRQEATAQKATEKITKRLETWKSSSLNIAGRVVLIRAVLQTLPQHLMFAASLMRTDAEEIDRLAHRFLWAGGRTERVIHYINWEMVTSEKATGGLGIRRTPILRVASLAIMAYRVLLQPSMVQQVFGLKYKWSGNPWELPRVQRSSRIWRRLCEGLTLIRQHVRKIPGSFTKWNIWRARNLVIFQHQWRHPRWVARWALSHASECLNHLSKEEVLLDVLPHQVDRQFVVGPEKLARLARNRQMSSPKNALQVEEVQGDEISIGSSVVLLSSMYTIATCGSFWVADDDDFPFLDINDRANLNNTNQIINPINKRTNKIDEVEIDSTKVKRNDVLQGR